MKKAIKWILIVFAVLFLFLLAAPFLFKDKIITAIKTEANKNLEADFNFSSLDLSLIRHFPNLSLTLNDLSIINRAPFQGDTLIFAKEVSLTVDLMSVIGGKQIEIRRVFLDKAVMNFLVNKEEKANWDITKPAPPGAPAGESSAFKASLNYYEAKAARVVYDDRSLDFRLQIDGLNHHGKGDFTQDLFVLSTHSEADQLTMNYGGMDYLKRVKTVADADVDMDIKNMKFTFKDNKLVVNDLPVAFSGWLAMPAEDIDMDLKFATQKSDFKSLISLIPAIYSSQFSDLTAAGKISFDGFVKGRYNEKQMPGFGLTMVVDNGSFKYPSLPSDVRNVNMDLKISNPDGNTDHTVVNLSKFHLEMAGDAFDARLLLKTPISDPDLDAFARGRINLANVTKFMPLEKGTTLSGIITSDINLKGRLSAIQQQQYDRFSADGKLAVTGMNYSSPASGQPAVINNLELVFSPKLVSLNTLDAKVGKSDFKANGSLENFLAYAIKNDVLKGNLNLNSNLIDLNEFMTPASGAPAASDTSSLQVIDIPGNIDFVMTARVNRLNYQNLVISNASGALIIKDKAVRMKDLVMQLMGGSMKMNGAYNTADIKKPQVDFDLGITDFNIKQASAAFITIEKLAPIAKYADGTFSSTLTFSSALNSKMEPVLETASGYGKLNTQQISLSGFAPVTKLADALKINSLKQLAVPNTNISFNIKGGRIYVEPFDVTVNGMKATVAGSNGLDQSIDYGMNMNVPRSLFGGAANSVLDNMVTKANAAGTNFSVGDQVPVEAMIKGTVADPKISLNISKAGASMMKDLKAKAQAELEAKAKEEADRLKKEAQAKANAEIDKVKKEAEAKSKAYSDSVKKAAQKAAKDQLEKFNPFKKK